MEQSTAGLYNFVKQGLLMAAVCSILLTNVDPAQALDLTLTDIVTRETKRQADLQ